jgi:glycosyltransferase involved in cell wall biosynthesis
VATDVGGIGEAVENGSSGKLVAAGDHTALARAVCGLLDDPGEGRRMGEQASARVRERFSTEAMIARLGGVYDEIVPSEAVPARRSQTMSGTPGT